jgi:hypothetical protein
MPSFGRFCLVVASVTAIQKYVGGVLTTSYNRTFSNVVCVDLLEYDSACQTSFVRAITDNNSSGVYTASSIEHTIQWSYSFQTNIKIYKSTSGTANGPWSLVRSRNVTESSVVQLEQYTETVALPTVTGQTLSYYYKAVATNKCGDQQAAIAYQTYTKFDARVNPPAVSCVQCPAGAFASSYYWTGTGGNQWLKYIGNCTWVGPGNTEYSQVALRWDSSLSAWGVTVLSKSWGQNRFQSGPSTPCSPKGTYLNLGRIS